MTMIKKAYKNKIWQLKNPSSSFIPETSNQFFRRAVFNMPNKGSWRTTWLFPWTGELVRTMLTLENVKTKLDSFLSKKDSNYLNKKVKIYKKVYHKDFRLVQILSVGEAILKQIMRLRNQLVTPAENFGGEQNWSPLQTSTMSKDMDD